MYYVISFLVLAAVILSIYFFGRDTVRLIKTVVLIARVEPFERRLSAAPNILVLGDSTGYGTGATKAVDSIAGRIGAAFPKYSIINESKNGRNMEGLQEKVTQVSGTYELILLQIGGNDILQKRDLGVVEVEHLQSGEGLQGGEVGD